MKTPKTVKTYLKLLITIAKDESINLRNVTENEMLFIGNIRGAIQNELSEDEWGIMKKHNLKYNG